MKAEREKLNAKTVAAQLRLTNGEYQLQEGEDRFYGWFPLMFSIPRPDWF